MNFAVQKLFFSFVCIVLINPIVCYAKIFQYKPREAFAYDHSGYLRQKFVIEVDDRANLLLKQVPKKKLLALMCAVGGALGGGNGAIYLLKYFGKSPNKKDIKKNFRDLLLGSSSLMLLGVVVGGGLTYKICSKTNKAIERFIKEYIAFKILEEFVREWPANRLYTQREYHDAFDRLCELSNSVSEDDHDEFKVLGYKLVREIRESLV